jgi:hypothetical protein
LAPAAPCVRVAVASAMARADPAPPALPPQRLCPARQRPGNGRLPARGSRSARQPPRAHRTDPRPPARGRPRCPLHLFQPQLHRGRRHARSGHRAPVGRPDARAPVRPAGHGGRRLRPARTVPRAC